MSTLKITHASFQMKLQLIDIGKLKPHEQIIPDLVDSLSKKMAEDGIFINPIMVDSESLVILDGMHRYNAAVKLGLRLVPALLVDYASESILLKRWWRKAKLNDPTKMLFLRIFRSSVRRRPRSASYLELVVEGSRMYYPVKGELLDSYRLMAKMEKRLSEQGAIVEYVHEYDLRKHASEDVILFSGARLKKQDVVNVVKLGELFPHKSTCHVFPARIYNINVPLKYLRLSEEEGNRRLIEYLKNRRLVYLRGVGRGRYERKYVFV